MAVNDRHKLVWTASTVTLQPLPPHITKYWIKSPGGDLELLYAQPLGSEEPRKQVLLFQHGGFGYAGVWIPFMTWFSQRGYSCYAISLRGHGGSWKPGFFQMVWKFGKASFAEDLHSAITATKTFEGNNRNTELDVKDLVLVGHSAGGGLSQYYLSQGLGTVGALVIVAGFPCSGGLGVYWNWFKLDPWFALRYYFRDLWHPRSPLSSTTLVHRAFFSPSFPVPEVKKFERWMPEFESMRFPLGMMFPFANTHKVLGNIMGRKTDETRLLVIAGEKDTLMGVSLMQKMALLYRKARSKFKNISRQENDEKNREDSLESGVRFEVIQGSGHHIQNDLYWEDCAGKILLFLQQL